MPDRLVSGAALGHLLYSGSVKDVYGDAGHDPYLFLFSDRYSIFDWGEMPDSLPGKGEALAVMGDLFFRELGKPWGTWHLPESRPKFWRDSFSSSPVFRRLKTGGLPHHSLGLVDAQGFAQREGTLTRRLAVRALERPAAIPLSQGGKLTWDYSAYASRPDRCLVPLEVVFRFGAPEGSSFLARAAGNPGYAQSFGFTDSPKAGEMFPFPILEFFTKLEPTDRFLTRDEAVAVAALTPPELDDLVALATLLALRLRELFAPLGLTLWDGKFEFAFVPGPEGRGFQLVDSIGPDELRLIGPEGVHFSKESLRRVYRDSPWYEAMEKAKKLARERGEKDWKKICREELGQEPGRLPAEALENARLMLPSLANGLAKAFLGRSIYENVPAVSELCSRIAAGGRGVPLGGL
jgi:phosphoribosylaminoimidazole-succinocarboxamide synthase